FKDADLIGFPLRITVGKALQSGKVELKLRGADKVQEIPVSEVLAEVRRLIAGAALPASCSSAERMNARKVGVFTTGH
ncbi:MAG: hypothetical protein HY692_07250, partial [Cyanobacteria bacterium NC_groundwater_1444_Ag_S-0.65um_54_12]|nr:hypothetical protein [Cyanobacteria bacterium NC_groundwater_1444_Ag_S-0.65um_54_12]